VEALTVVPALVHETEEVEIILRVIDGANLVIFIDKESGFAR
jgi:hypothetical protein